MRVSNIGYGEDVMGEFWKLRREVYIFALNDKRISVQKKREKEGKEGVRGDKGYNEGKG